jgi:GNAT superfamily N-acetyltransferase
MVKTLDQRAVLLSQPLPQSSPLSRSLQSADLLPAPRLADHLRIRPGELRDEPFVDHCQKLFKGHLGFLYQSTIARRIMRGDLLIAEDQAGNWAGLLLGTTSYDRNDAVSRIDQVAVVPALQRRNIGGALLAHWIDHLPRGVRLICCWCAQDLREGRFWEAQGFVPLAFRSGGQGGQRMHIFWERRCNIGDTSTQWWYPRETSGGQMSAARIVLPIPPGLDWREVELPKILPVGAGSITLPAGPVSPAALRAAGELPGRPGSKPSPRALLSPGEFQARQRAKAAHLQPRGPISPAIAGRQHEAPRASEIVVAAPKKERPKNLPEHIAAAREIRDRFLDSPLAAALVEQGKYCPARQAPASLASATSGLAAALFAGLGGPPALPGSDDRRQ